jgi:hypothetical protein
VLLPPGAAVVPKRATASSSDRKPANVTLLPQSCGRGTSAVLNRHVVGSLQATASACGQLDLVHTPTVWHDATNSTQEMAVQCCITVQCRGTYTTTAVPTRHQGEWLLACKRWP